MASAQSVACTGPERCYESTCDSPGGAGDRSTADGGKAGQDGTGGPGAHAGAGADVGEAGSDRDGACPTACASYQFCASTECLPTYESTFVLPTIDQARGTGQVTAAVVLADKPHGNIIVQLSGDLVVSDSPHTEIADAGYASYTPDGRLTWSSTSANLLDSAGTESAMVLVSTSDFAVSYVKVDSDTSSGSMHLRTSRLDGYAGNLKWEAKYPSETNDTDAAKMLIVPRPAQGDLFTAMPAMRGVSQQGNELCIVTDSGTSGSVICSATNYAINAVPGSDGATAWIWGAPIAGTYKLNPVAESEWSFTANPSEFDDDFILGIRGASASVGPWMTEGDYGPDLVLATLPEGDLAIAAHGTGYASFNRGQPLLAEAGDVLVRLDTKTGQIVWNVTLGQSPAAMVTAPGGRIAILNRPSHANPSVDLFDAATGAALSTLPLPASANPILAAGLNDLYVLGDYSSAFDFDPGTGTDQPAATRGVYVSRYSF